MALALRPTFSIDLPEPSRDVIDHLGAALGSGRMQLRRTRPPGGGGPKVARLDRDHLVLTVPAAERHFWSPWLTMEVSPRARGTHLVGSFSPHPSVWTGFMFGYLTLGVVLMFSLLFAGASLMMGGSLWTLWISGGAIAALGAMWWASQLGQRLARAQMDALRGELDRALGAAPPIGE